MAYTAPTQRTTGTLITAAIYNTDIVDNIVDLNTRVPTNLVAHTTATSAPTGWAEYTAGRGRVIVGTPASGTHGGTVGSALTDLENRTHDHTYTTVIAHIHSYNVYIAPTGGDGRPTEGQAVSPTTLNTNSTGSASGTTATGTALPPYMQLLSIQKS